MNEKKRRLLWRLFPSYLLVTVLSLISVAWFASNFVSKLYLDQTVADLKTKALFFQNSISDHLEPLNQEAIDQACKKIGPPAQTRITVILPSGQVAGDSNEDPGNMDNHSDRPEVREAAAGDVGVSSRFSRTLGRKMMYVAVPMTSEHGTSVIVRTAVSISLLDEALAAIRSNIAAGGLLIAVVAALISLYVSRRIARPIEKMKEWAESVAQGDALYNPPEIHSEEIHALSSALHKMGLELQERIDLVTRQRNQMEAVFSSMAEGVIAVDTGHCIISMNLAAGQMLECDPEESRDKTVQEVVRNAELLNFVELALEAREPVEKDFSLFRPDGSERYFKARGVILNGPDSTPMGALVVLNDVTQVERLENMRRDFVANVSHEIKTPITAIKGFVETLADGGVENPEDAARFLEIISRHSDRLRAIVDDLLELSRIEHAGEFGISMEQSSVIDAINTAVQVCESRARELDVSIEVSCPPDMTGVFDLTLMEQALVNLLDNAVKYSPGGAVVHVSATQTESETMIQVKDSGQGIDKEHLHRLFERFYRVDKARSRRLGGTGLGLAIVKHIMAAHNGKVTVESRKGSGSSFFLHFPKQQG